MEQTAWSMLPPIITIVLALLTKEVYMSFIAVYRRFSSRININDVCRNGR